MRTSAVSAMTVAAILLSLAAWPAGAAETSIGPRGQVIVNGKAVVPRALWMQPTYLFEYHRQLGMTCVIMPRMERGEFRRAASDLQTALKRSGLGAVMSGRRAKGQSAATPTWAWMGGVMRPGRLDWTKRPYASIRRKDKGRFVLTNIDVHDILGPAGVKNRKFFTEALKHTDAVISHVWPRAIDPAKPDIRSVAVFVDRVREYSKGRPGGEVSIWPDINPHKWKLKDKLGGTKYPAPTREELRFQIWLALIHGADGISFFPITFDPFVYCQIPAKNEQELAWNTKLIERMTNALTAKPSTLKITVTGNLPNGIIDVTTRQLAGEHYVFVVNGVRKQQTVTLKAPGLGGKWILHDAIKQKTLRSANGQFIESLGPLALRIWRISPAPPARKRSTK